MGVQPVFLIRRVTAAVPVLSVVLAGAFLLWPIPGLSHGGGLDAMGCHPNRKAGGYHCHRGPLAGRYFASKDEAARAPQRVGQAQPPARSAAPPAAAPLTGVASVIDGDTLEIHGQRIRLHGVDAPESAQMCKDGQGKDYRCGQQAALALADRIGRRPIACEKRDVDRYKRIVAVCRLGSEDLNAWLVSEGLAMAYRQYSADYAAQEDHARATGCGLWRGEFAPPWDWRRQHKGR